MTPIGNEPCPVAMAKQRARAAMAFGAVSFIAVGAIAWIGLDALRAPASSTIASTSAAQQAPATQSLTENLPVAALQDEGSAATVGAQTTLTSQVSQEKADIIKAILKSAGTNLELLDLNEVEELAGTAVQSDPKREAARLAILQNAGTNLELLDLSEVEQLTGSATVTTQPASAPTNVAAATQTQPEPTLEQGFEEIRFLAVEGGLQASDASEETVVVSNPAQTATSSSTITQIAATDVDCVADLRNFASSQTILFGSGSAELQGSELPKLRKIGRMAQACEGALVHVTGHSDTSGSDIINLALSWQRADNTVATLAALGIDTAQFEPVGFGARSPSAQGDSSDEEKNRRVEFVVFEAAGHHQ